MEYCRVVPLPDNVYQVVLCGENEHRFNPASIDAIVSALDEVLEDPKAAALVTTSEGRFFSNGLDLAWTGGDPSKLAEELIPAFHKLLLKMLTYPIPTVAAICGHAVAGGCMYALAHDYRIMTSDKGYVFLNEVDIMLPLTPGMCALIKSKMPSNTFRTAVLSGHRFTGKAAVESGFVDASAANAELTVKEALSKGRALAKREFQREVYQTLKMEMFKNEIKELEEEDSTELSDVTTVVSKL